MTRHVSPRFHKTAFNCPICGAFSDQEWFSAAGEGKNGNYTGKISWLQLAECRHCSDYTIWKHERGKWKMIFPSTGNAPLPNTDMPTNIKSDYEEARSIVNLSPRGAAALLRLAIQKLCIHLGEKGKDLNHDIGNLVKKGLSPKAQKALDIVRVIGNNAVHPGQIDLKDDTETANKLFVLVNVISDVMISQPKQIDELYESKVPDSQKEAIEKRDSGK